jgi:hypothetical protein
VLYKRLVLPSIKTELKFVVGAIELGDISWYRVYSFVSGTNECVAHGHGGNSFVLVRLLLISHFGLDVLCRLLLLHLCHRNRVGRLSQRKRRLPGW